MKKTIFFPLVLITLLWVGCSRTADTSSLLADAETRDQVFTAILDDHELMTEFMNKLMSNEHATMMMKGNHDMMGLMTADGSMMKMMKDNPSMLHNMMSDMMKDGEMMKHMIQMMSQEGMMSEECLQSSMSMIAEKNQK